MTRNEWNATSARLAALEVGQEYPVTLWDGTVTVSREAEAVWVVSVSIASHPAGVYTASETVPTALEAIAMVGALL